MLRVLVHVAVEVHLAVVSHNIAVPIDQENSITHLSIRVQCTDRAGNHPNMVLLCQILADLQCRTIRRLAVFFHLVEHFIRETGRPILRKNNHIGARCLCHRRSKQLSDILIICLRIIKGNIRLEQCKIRHKAILLYSDNVQHRGSQDT